jgi:DNA (cytosine-5)-methyltransferase 1
VDAKGYVPQHRERVFILGWRDDQKVSMEDIRFKASENGPRLDSVLHREDGSEVEDERFVGGDGRVLPKYTLTDKLWEYLQAYAEKHKSRGNGFGFGLVTPEDTARTLSARYFKDGSEILVAQKGKNPRRLTPRECARLMGFENPQESRFAIPVSDTQAYKQFGNAVVVPVIQEIALALRDALSEKSEQESPQGDLLLDVG